MNYYIIESTYIYYVYDLLLSIYDTDGVQGQI